MSVKPNRIWSLTEDNEIATKQAWGILLKQWGYDLDNYSFGDLEHHENFVSSTAPNELPDLSVGLVVSKCPPVSERTSKTFTTMNGNSEYMRGRYDKSVKVTPKDTYRSFAKTSIPGSHQAFLATMRLDSPDNLFLRFMRARKFKVHNAVEMFAAWMRWHTESYPVAKWVADGDLTIAFSGNYPELVKAFEMNKFYIRGKDKTGGRICVIRVKQHFGSDCPEKDFEILICLFIEWCRLASTDYHSGNDGANILFDMSGFSLKNADLNAVRFLAKAFEANYPECLNAIWVHKAPWIFNAVWKIIKGWLDPVVASKIHFTKLAADLEKFADIDQIPQDLGGKDDYVPQYVTPTESNSATKPADDTMVQLLSDREMLTKTFYETTIAWINAKSREESTELLNLKIHLGAELASNYLALDPYVRHRGAFDRDGSLDNMSY